MPIHSPFMEVIHSPFKSSPYTNLLTRLISHGTFTRSSAATMWSEGKLVSIGSNIARLDTDPLTHKFKGLLIEEARSNLFTQSSDITHADWAKTELSTTSNVVLSPDGTLNADLIKPSTNNLSHYMLQEHTLVSGAEYSQTVFVKASGYNFIQLLGSTGFDSTNLWFNFNLTDGSVGSGGTLGSASIEEVGGGWYRIAITGTSSATFGRILIAVLDVDTPSRLPSFIGDGISGVHIFGAQVEQGSFPTSYIPTTLTSGSRATETAYVPITAFDFNPLEGTLYADFQRLSGSNTFTTTVSLDDGSTDNLIRIIQHTDVANKVVGARITAGAVSQMLTSTSTGDSNIRAKTALAYKLNDCAITMNAVTVVDNLVTLPTNLSTLRIANSGGGVTKMSGHIKELRYYSTRLTTSRLESLTT